jgi:hypothetical protein
VLLLYSIGSGTSSRLFFLVAFGRMIHEIADNSNSGRPTERSVLGHADTLTNSSQSGKSGRSPPSSSPHPRRDPRQHGRDRTKLAADEQANNREYYDSRLPERDRLPEPIR